MTTNPSQIRQFEGDIYTSRDYLHDRYQRAYEALQAAPRGSYASHNTAGELRGLWVPSSPQIHVSMMPNAGRRLYDGVQTHRGRTDAWVSDIAGVRASRPEQIVVENARSLNLVPQVALIDSVLHRQYSDVAGLRAYADQQRVRSRVLDRALCLARPGAGSAMETHTRLLIATAGFPETELQIRVPVAVSAFTAEQLRVIDEHTPLPPAALASRREVVFKLDIGYSNLRLAAEFDGEHHEAPEQRAYDEIRREALVNSGWTIHTVTTTDIFTSPAAFLTEFATSYNSLSPTPVNCSDEWRNHFVDRHRRGFSTR